MIVMLALTALPVSPAYAATAGPNTPDVGVEANNTIGTVAWNNEGNITADDTNYATTVLGNSAVSEYLQATDFDFAIPAGATINGIQVTIMRQSSSNSGNDSVQDWDLFLLKGGAIVGTDHASGNDWPTSMQPAAYGATNDLWGTTWTVAEINAANFGVALSVENESNNTRTGSVDYIQVTVTYTLPSTTIGDGTSPSSKAVGASSTNNAVSSFTLTASTGTDTVTDLVVTGAGTGLANVAPNGVKLWRDNGTVANEWDAGDTAVTGGTASFAGATATFAGLNIGVTTTSAQYIVTYNIVAAPTAGQTMTAVVSGATTTTLPVTNTDTVDATLTIGLTITVTTGAGGTIQSPVPTVVSGSVGVASGSNRTFDIVPNTGFIVSDVLVDGVTVGRVNTYTFNNILINHTISATFDGGWSQPSTVSGAGGWGGSGNAFTSNNSRATSNSFMPGSANFTNFNIPAIPASSGKKAAGRVGWPKRGTGWTTRWASCSGG
jgi:hypothetical protein